MITLYNFYMNLARKFNLEFKSSDLKKAVDGEPREYETVIDAWQKRGNELDIYEKTLEVNLDVQRVLKSTALLYNRLPGKTNIPFLDDSCSKIETYFPEMSKGSDWKWVPFIQHVSIMLERTFPKYGNCKNFATNFLIYVRSEWSGSTDVDMIWDFVNVKNKYRFTGNLDRKEVYFISDVRNYVEDLQKQRCFYY